MGMLLVSLLQFRNICLILLTTAISHRCYFVINFRIFLRFPSIQNKENNFVSLSFTIIYFCTGCPVSHRSFASVGFYRRGTARQCVLQPLPQRPLRVTLRAHPRPRFLLTGGYK